jgi:hypothetical protein
VSDSSFFSVLGRNYVRSSTGVVHHPGPVPCLEVHLGTSDDALNFQGQRECGENPDPMSALLFSTLIPSSLQYSIPDPVIYIPNCSSQLIFLAGKILIGPSRKWLDTEAVRDLPPVPEDQSNEAPKSGDGRYLAEHPMSWMCSTLDPLTDQRAVDLCNVGYETCI